MKRTAFKDAFEVFGISPIVLPDSYVDRGHLDEKIRSLIAQSNAHIAIRGVSKCGKSWLRQKMLPDAIVVQCRLRKSVDDIYREALGALGIRLEVSSTNSSNFVGRVEASGEFGTSLIAKVIGKAGLERSKGKQHTTRPVSADVDDLSFVVKILHEARRTLVIEDFHYLSIGERQRLAFDLKAMWDLRFFVVVVGVWDQQNMLLALNSDLSARVEEVSIVWAKSDLEKILQQGGMALNVEFTPALRDKAIEICYGNAGILQTLILRTLDWLGIRQEQQDRRVISDVNALEESALYYVEQLHPLYQEFARSVSNGIRARRNSTGIYAHALAVILSSSDQQLIRGISLHQIYQAAHAREPRITKQNLQRALERIESLQVDTEGRGLVLAYNSAIRDVTVVDRQLLLYRRYSTIGWPWEDIASEASGNDRFNAD
ncbi:hypothetical protein [Streptomyces collinus]